MESVNLYLPSGKLVIRLNESKTAKALYMGGPYQGQAQFWGDELYFSIPLRLEEESPVSVVEVGDVAYWRPGQAICVFFGPTPDSTEDEIRPASPVDLVGKIEGDLNLLKEVKTGHIITVSF
jgi:hypothetical protein